MNLIEIWASLSVYLRQIVPFRISVWSIVGVKHTYDLLFAVCINSHILFKNLYLLCWRRHTRRWNHLFQSRSEFFHCLWVKQANIPSIAMLILNRIDADWSWGYGGFLDIYKSLIDFSVNLAVLVIYLIVFSTFLHFRVFLFLVIHIFRATRAAAVRSRRRSVAFVRLTAITLIIVVLIFLLEAVEISSGCETGRDATWPHMALLGMSDRIQPERLALFLYLFPGRP